MHKYYFPKCKVEGPIYPPVPFGHLGSIGALPFKCSKCEYLFEGVCIRYMGEVDYYLHLDHGPCSKTGPTDPVMYEDSFIFSKVEIPRKCSKCMFLKVESIEGFYCSKDNDKWGDFHRGLDWGEWKPNSMY